MIFWSKNYYTLPLMQVLQSTRKKHHRASLEDSGGSPFTFDWILDINIGRYVLETHV